MYLAQLMSAHPLYPAAERLSREISHERRELALAELGQGLLAPWSPVVLTGPGVPAYPPASLRQDWAAWEGALQTPPEPGLEALPADLEASRRWAYGMIEARVARQLAQVRADETRRLAELRRRLVEERLHELTNLGLDLEMPAAEVEAYVAEQTRRLWDEVEAQLAQERAASEVRVALAREQLQAEAIRLKAEADAAATEEAQRRQAQMMPQLTEPRSQMRERLEALVAERAAGGREAQVLEADLPVEYLEGAARGRAEALQALGETRRRQLQRLEESRSALLRLILEDTRRAVSVIAFRDNLTLHLIPAGRAQGPNLTAALRPRVEGVWAGRSIEETTDRRGYSQP